MIKYLELISMLMMGTAGEMTGEINAYRDMCPGYEETLSARDMDAVNTLMENLWVNKTFTNAYRYTLFAIVDIKAWEPGENPACPTWKNT